MERYTFQAKLKKKKKKFYPEKNFFYFRKWKPQKISYIFSKESFSDILGIRKPKKVLTFQEVRKIKRTHC